MTPSRPCYVKPTPLLSHQCWVRRRQLARGAHDVRLYAQLVYDAKRIHVMVATRCAAEAMRNGGLRTTEWRRMVHWARERLNAL